MIPGIVASSMLTGGAGGGGASLVNFANDGATFPIYGTATYPSAFYVAATDKTYFFHEAYYANQRWAICISYDHATDTWSDDYPIAVVSEWLTDDDHGVPAGFRDAGGFLHWFGGAHNQTLRHYKSRVADNITEWDVQTAVGTAYTYPHPVFDGTSLYLFARSRIATGPDQMTLVLRKSTSITAGVITFASEVTLINLGGDSRVYLGNTHDDGTYIHLITTRSDGGDNFRQDVYHFKYRKSDGAILNADGSHTISSGSLPIGLSDANTYYRIVDQATPGRFSNVPAFCVDTSGNLHLVYTDGATGTGTSWDLKHKVCVSGTWGSATTIVALTNSFRGNAQAIGPLAGGDVELLYPDNDGTYSRGGIEMKRRVYSGGSWGSATTVATDLNGKAVDQPSCILSGVDIARMHFCEIAQDSLNSSAGGLFCYAYGATGLALRSIPTHDLQVLTQCSFDDANNATKTFGESMQDPKYTPPTFAGNAKISTTEKKFGTASLFLDGTGDFIQFQHGDSAAHSVGNADDKCFEAWIYPTSIAKAINTIFNKRPSSGGATEFTSHITSAGAVGVSAWNSGGSVVLNLASSAGAVVINTWQHIAITRESGFWRVFIDGVLVASGAQSGTPGSNSVGLCIGKDNQNSGREFTGYVDEVRILHGRAEYVAGFTPPSAAYARP